MGLFQQPARAAGSRGAGGEERFDRAGAVTKVSPRVLDAFGVVGPEADCRKRMAEFARAGLTMPVVVPFAPEGDRRASVLRTIRAFSG